MLSQETTPELVQEIQEVWFAVEDLIVAQSNVLKFDLYCDLSGYGSEVTDSDTCPYDRIKIEIESLEIDGVNCSFEVPLGRQWISGSLQLTYTSAGLLMLESVDVSGTRRLRPK